MDSSATTTVPAVAVGPAATEDHDTTDSKRDDVPKTAPQPSIAVPVLPGSDHSRWLPQYVFYE
jgi:hypothetical protein